jgi:hypothetical protein
MVGALAKQIEKETETEIETEKRQYFVSAVLYLDVAEREQL